MRRVSAHLFGFVMPMVEVLLVIAGLALLGWEGVVYTWTGVWTTIPLAALDPSGQLIHAQPWLAHLPLAGTCLVAGVMLFFIMPPAYSHL